MSQNQSSAQSGMSIVSVLVAAAIFGILMMSMSTFMTDTIKVGKAVDAKSQVQSLESLIRLSLAKPENCASIMGLSKIPHPLSFASANLPAPGGTTFSLPVPGITIGGKTYATGGTEGDLQITDMYLLIDQPISTGSDQYIASLNVPTKLAQGKAAGPGQYLVKLPIKITIEKTGATAKVVGCNADSLAIDPEQTCEEMGGKWFSGEQGDMINERCAFGSETTLAFNERPDHINRNGLANDNGEAPVECYYRASAATARVQVWKCPQTLAAGYRCWFDSSAKRWNVGYFSAGTTSNVPVRNPSYYECNKGVKIAISPEDSETFSNGILSLPRVAGNSSLPLANDPLHDIYLPAIMGCKKNSSDLTPISCENQDDPSKDTLSNGKMGKNSNGCFFVRNARVYIGGTYLQGIYKSNKYDKASKTMLVPQAGAFGDDSDTGSDTPLSTDGTTAYGYTGWVVASGYTRTIAANAGTVTSNQALGYPCEVVQVNAQTLTELNNLAATLNTGAPGPGFSTTRSDSSGASEAQKLQECTWSATGGSTAIPGSPQTYFANSKVLRVGGTAAVANTSGNAGTEVLGRDFCTNYSQLGSATLKEALDGKSATGDTVKVNMLGICVYVKDQYVANFFPKAKAKTYTGWLKLRVDYGNPATGAPKYGFDTNEALKFLLASGSVDLNAEINGLPCSRGIVSYNGN